LNIAGTVTLVSEGVGKAPSVAVRRRSSPNLPETEENHGEKTCQKKHVAKAELRWMAEQPFHHSEERHREHYGQKKSPEIKMLWRIFEQLVADCFEAMDFVRSLLRRHWLWGWLPHHFNNTKRPGLFVADAQPTNAGARLFRYSAEIPPVTLKA
jgi:hypothetical protein